jgi:hypothetical protein
LDVFWIRAISQTGIYVTFFAYLIWTARRGPRVWVPFVGTLLYALIFEHFNMLRYAHAVGGYNYNPCSWLFLWGDVPLYIPLAWAFIVSTSQALTDRLGLREWSRPYCDALLALLIDLSLDVVAIRLNFWYWRGVGRDDAFFGVPADNFLGWLLVTFTFSLLTRRLWRSTVTERAPLLRRALLQWVVVPPTAYILYLAIERGVHLADALFHATTLRAELGILGGVIACFLAAVVVGSRAGAGDSDSPTADCFNINDAPIKTSHVPPGWRSLAEHGPRHIFHIFGLIGLMYVPIAARTPALWLITATVWTVEWAITWRIGRR